MTKGWRLRCKKYPNLMFGKALSNAKRRAAKRKLPFEIDKEYIINLYESQSGRCYYSDIPLRIVKESESKMHDNFKMTLDCIDHSLGYTKGNVVWCAYCVNSFKQDMKKDDMIKICISIMKKNNIKI
jgi:hypothetical protein